MCFQLLSLRRSKGGARSRARRTRRTPTGLLSTEPVERSAPAPRPASLIAAGSAERRAGGTRPTTGAGGPLARGRLSPPRRQIKRALLRNALPELPLALDLGV